jgi:hypothetical protein
MSCSQGDCNKGEDISSYEKHEYKQVKRKQIEGKRYNEKTLRCISSLLNLDTFSAKRKKPLHQRLQSTNCVRISEFKNKQNRLYEAILTCSEEEDG